MRRAYGEKEITMQQISSPEKQHLHMQPGISIIRESFHGKMIIPEMQLCKPGTMLSLPIHCYAGNSNYIYTISYIRSNFFAPPDDL